MARNRKRGGGKPKEEADPKDEPREKKEEPKDNGDSAPREPFLQVWGGLLLALIALALFWGYFFGVRIDWYRTGQLMLVLLIPVAIGAYFFVPYWLAQRNMFWTIVEEGWTKQVVHNGEFERSILVMGGHELDADSNVVPNPSKPLSRKGGLSWVGIYPFYQVYVRDMKFSKAVGATYEKRNDPHTDFFLMVDYQYALLFKDCEDKNLVPLSGHMTMTAQAKNARKALFRVKNWFDAVEGRILPRIREYTSRFTYEELINNPKDLDAEVQKMLRDPGTDGSPSIIDQLLEEYGILVKKLETVNIGPPPEYLEATTQTYLAGQYAKKESIETGGARRLMVKQRLSDLAKRLGFVKPKGGKKVIDQDKLRDYLKDNPQVIEKIEAEERDMLLRDRAGEGLKDIRMAGANGEKLDPAAALFALYMSAKSGGGAKKTPSDDDTGTEP